MTDCDVRTGAPGISLNRTALAPGFSRSNAERRSRRKLTGDSARILPPLPAGEGWGEGTVSDANQCRGQHLRRFSVWPKGKHHPHPRPLSRRERGRRKGLSSNHDRSSRGFPYQERRADSSSPRLSARRHRFLNEGVKIPTAARNPAIAAKGRPVPISRPCSCIHASRWRNEPIRSVRCPACPRPWRCAPGWIPAA